MLFINRVILTWKIFLLQALIFILNNKGNTQTIETLSRNLHITYIGRIKMFGRLQNIIYDDGLHQYHSKMLGLVFRMNTTT